VTDKQISSHFAHTNMLNTSLKFGLKGRSAKALHSGIEQPMRIKSNSMEATTLRFQIATFHTLMRSLRRLHIAKE
jgi:hypothetical protein